jgi:hypothetical protein
MLDLAVLSTGVKRFPLSVRDVAGLASAMLVKESSVAFNDRKVGLVPFQIGDEVLDAPLA